jgi:hypothetical protein
MGDVFLWMAVALAVAAIVIGWATAAHFSGEDE